MRTVKELNPICAVLYFAAVLAVPMFCMSPVLLIISLVGSLACFAVCGRAGGSHWLMLLVFLATSLVNPLFSHRGETVLFFLNDSPITLEALAYGVCMACALTASLYWFRLLSCIMTEDKSLYLLGRISPKLALITSMAMRYVALLSRRAKEIKAAQTALGLYKDGNVIDRARGGLRVFSALVSYALENGIITADSMSARGYGTGRRTSFSHYRFRLCDLAFCLLCIVLLCVTVVSIALGAVDFAFYPVLPRIPSSSLALLGYAAYGLLVVLPILLEVKEAVRWKYLRSKI